MKRRFFAMLLSLAMLFTLAPTAFAADGGSGTLVTRGTCGATQKDNVTWTLKQNNEGNESPTYTLTISGSGDMADYYAQYVQRAAEFDGDIAPWRRALLSGTNAERTTEEIVPITEVVIGDDVTRIGSGAFAYTELTGTVTFNENVHSYGDGVFAKDTSITAVDWTNFKPTVKIKDGWVKSYTEEHIAVPYAFFDGCSSLATSIIDNTEYSGELVLPDSVDAIYVAAFRGTGFSTVDFSDRLASIKSVGSYAISGLENMTEFTYPGNVDFYGMDENGRNNVIKGGGLKKLTIAKEVTVLPAYFCTETNQLTDIEFESESQLKKIGKMAFYDTQALKSIDIPSTVTAIGESAFADCFSLEKIELGHIESFGPNTFARCSSLKTAKIQGSSDVAYPSNMFGTWGTGHSAAPLKTLEIDAGKIQFSLSNQKDSIETVVLGDGVTEIPNNFAANCTKLTSVSLPDALTSVPVNAFKGCSSLEKVGISENSELQSIGSNAFQNSGLTQIYIPKNVTSIGTGAFNRTPITVFDMSDVLAESMTVGDYAINNWYSQEDVNNWPTWKDNFKCIYVSNSGVANSVKAKTSNCNYAFFVTNGGSVDTTKTGFSAVYRTGYSATWYKTANFSSGSAVTGTPGNQEIYYAKWTKSDSVTLTSDPTANESGTVTAAYNPNGTVTLSVQNPGEGWLYTWMKNGEQISAVGNSLTLYTPSESGEYSVQIMTKGSNPLIWTSNAINVTITKANVTNTAKENVHHTFGTIYDVSNLFSIDPNAGNATYKLAENTDENAGTATLEGNLLTVTKAGTVKVSLTTAETDNYNAGSAVTATLIVDKAAPTIKISADQTSLTGSGTVKLTVTPNGVPTEGKIEVTCDNGITVNNKDGTFTATLPNETKTYTFTASYAGDDNHNNATATCKVSVTHRSSGSSSGSSTTTSNSVSASTASNGKVSLDKSTAKKGDTVTVTVTPDAGYQLDKLTVTDKNGTVLKLTDKGDGKYSFTMPDGKVEVKAVFAKEVKTSPFGDVSTDAYYYKAVQWAQEKGITDGISSDLFGPKQPCTRSQIVTFLWRAAGSPEPKGTAAGMTDVVPGSYYAKAVAWAVENGITTGTAEGTFSPDATCTRAQAVTFLARAQNATATGKTAFSDVPADSYFADAVAWAQANGVTTGTSETTFSPDNDCTRAQIVTFLYRANQGT